LPGGASVVSAVAPSTWRRGKVVLAAVQEWTRCQQNAKAENILKTKGVKLEFSQNEAENILKIR
jgi:hypothetical protein